MSRELGVKWLIKQNWDFDEIPGVDDFEMFMKTILICANGDGRLHPQERQWVIGFAAAIGAPDKLVEDLKTWKPEGDYKQLIESRFSGVQSKRSLIYLAIQACSADGEYNPGERTLVHSIGANIGVPEDVITGIEKIYEEERKLQKKRLELLYDAGKPF